MKCKGLHCGGCKDGGGAVGLVLMVVLALVIIGAIGKAVVSAARTAGHVLGDVLQVAIIGLAVLAAVAVAAVLTWAGFRVYRWDTRRRALAVPVAVQEPVQTNVWAEVTSSVPQAIEAPKPQLDSATVIRSLAREDTR